jgi:hypothetical protein
VCEADKDCTPLLMTTKTPSTSSLETPDGSIIGGNGAASC